jgi:TM2 domain-containing membrane protein YozV
MTDSTKQVSHNSPVLESRTNRNRVIAALLAIVLGGAGIHKFYLGRVGQGLLYIIFSWTFIPMVLGFIEGVSYLLSSDKSFAQKYG